MKYLYFLTSLEVNSENYFFDDQQEYSRWLYKQDNNFDYELKTYTPNLIEFEQLSKFLQINEEAFAKFKYVTKVPIWLKIQYEYFKSDDTLAEELSEFINNFLTLRQYFFNNYGIPSFKLDGRKIFYKKTESGKWKSLAYNALNKIDFFEYLKESIVFGEGSSDLLCSLAAEKTPLEFNWVLLIDAIKLFYEHNFRQSIISCCTSIEVTITEPVKIWLQDQTVTKSKDLISQLIMEVSNPLKFEFYIHSINPEPYKIYTEEELEKLVSEFKFLNKTRNKVAHQGYLTSVDEAKRAIEATSSFLRALWVYERKSFYDDLKKR